MCSKSAVLCILTVLLVQDAHSEYYPIQRLFSGQILRLNKDRYTIGYKDDRQLLCVGDRNLCDEYAPSTVTCMYEELLRWKCESSLRNGVLFNELNVECESAPTDKFIIEGSCKLM